LIVVTSQGIVKYRIDQFLQI